MWLLEGAILWAIVDGMDWDDSIGDGMIGGAIGWALWGTLGAIIGEELMDSDDE